MTGWYAGGPQRSDATGGWRLKPAAQSPQKNPESFNPHSEKLFLSLNFFGASPAASF